MLKKQSIIAMTVNVSVLIIIGKVLGFVRNSVIAAYFGANEVTDAFFLAEGMPGTIFPAVCNSISTAFISLYVKRLVENEKKGEKFASRTLVMTSLLAVVLSIIGVIAAPLYVPLLAPGFSMGQTDLAIYLTRLSMGAFFLTMLQYMLSAILNSKKFFIASNVAGVVYNVSIIVITILLGKGQSIDALMLTTIFGAFLQIVILGACTRRVFRYIPHQNPIHQDSLELLKLALPILIGNSVVQINTIVDKALGSTLEDGALSALNYGNVLCGFVIGVFVSALSTVLYPILTEQAVSGATKQYGRTVVRSLTGLSFILLPISCIALTDANQIVRIVYERGNFDQAAVRLTTIVLVCYAPRFFLAGIREIATRAMFAIQDTKSPMICGSIGVAGNIVFSLSLVRWIGIAGIAIGTTFSVMVTDVLLLMQMHRCMKDICIKKFFLVLIKPVIACGVLCVAICGFHNYTHFSNVLLRFIIDTVIGVAIYCVVLAVLKSKEFFKLVDFLRKSLCRNK